MELYECVLFLSAAMAKNESEPIESELILLLKKGNTKAFEAIYTLYWRKLYTYIFRHLQSKEDAEEILHEVFLSLWNNRTDSGIQNLGIYLFIATRNQLNRFIRSQINFRRYREFELWSRREENSSINEDFDELDFNTKLEQILARMPEKTATVFKLSKMEQLPIREIAHRMAMSEKAIEYHVTKSMKLIRMSFLGSFSDN